MKKLFILSILSLLILPSILFNPIKSVSAVEIGLENKCKAYVLMDKDSGKVLNENHADERMPVASIVKLMTILLCLENVKDGRILLEDKVSVSEHAAGMGGSQVFLDAGTEHKLGDLLKSVVLASANDSSVAIAEHIAGSEQLFVKMMNEKAHKLGMVNTNYENATGLPSANQYSSAKDVGIVLSKVLDYEIYQNYSKIWLEDYVHPSGRKTEMTNTNKLSRFYEGCLGGKTGSTNEAKYCLGVGAKRDNLSLIAVVLGSETSKDRFSNCSELLNYGFSTYENKLIFTNDNLKDTTIKMQGRDFSLNLKVERNCNIVCKKGEEISVKYNYNLPTSLLCCEKDEEIGYVDIIINGEKYDSINLLATQTIPEPTFLDYFDRIQKDFI